MQSTAVMQPGAPPLQRLLHRWFVEYNPLFLFSAVLVLGGTFLTSKGLAADGSVYGQLAVAGVAEVYSIALVAAAALLYRARQKRSAVMLALLAIVYQADLTLHTDAAANLGPVGVAASLLWVGLFVGKLRALAWAAKLRIERSAMIVAAAGAAGLAIGPYALRHVDRAGSTAAVALFVAALAGLGSREACGSDRAARSLVPLDDWGSTVLRRVVRTTWIVWGALLALHIGFWSTYSALDLRGVLAVLPLLAIHRIGPANEKRVWALAATVLVTIASAEPGSLSVAALIAAAVLAQRALHLHRLRGLAPAALGASATPYRVAGDAGVAAPAVPMPVPVAVATPHDGARPFAAEVRRLVLGSGVALYLALWTVGWSGGRWPAHNLALDAVFAALLVAFAVRARARLAFAPLVAGAGHLVISRGLLPEPTTPLGWGVIAIGAGFGLLFLSVAVSYALRERDGFDGGCDPPPVPPRETAT